MTKARRPDVPQDDPLTTGGPRRPEIDSPTAAIIRDRKEGARAAKRQRTRATPVILLGRYTTLAGAHTFTTSPLHVSAFDRVELVFWRGNPVGVAAAFTLYLEGSLDKNTWRVLSQLSAQEDVEEEIGTDLGDPWFRARVVISQDAAITCWLLGQLINRMQS